MPVEKLDQLGSSLSAGHNENTAFALLVVQTATSSTAIPHTPARAAPIKPTLDGWLSSPRCGGGERYGVSVSTITTWGSMTAAPLRTVSPVSNATGPANEKVTPSSENRFDHLGPPVQQCNTTQEPAP